MEVFFIKQELPINRQIRAKEVQLIGENGEKLGVMSLNEALEKALKKRDIYRLPSVYIYDIYRKSKRKN